MKATLRGIAFYERFDCPNCNESFELNHELKAVSNEPRKFTCRCGAELECDRAKIIGWDDFKVVRVRHNNEQLLP